MPCGRRLTRSEQVSFAIKVVPIGKEEAVVVEESAAAEKNTRDRV
jgi:hypothetical protein